MKRHFKNLGFGVLYTVVATLLNMLIAIFVKLAWNCFCHGVLGLPVINWIEAFSLTMLSSLLLPQKIVEKEVEKNE